jgi:hypothetical protein
LRIPFSKSAGKHRLIANWILFASLPLLYVINVGVCGFVRLVKSMLLGQRALIEGLVAFDRSRHCTQQTDDGHGRERRAAQAGTHLHASPASSPTRLSAVGGAVSRQQSIQSLCTACFRVHVDLPDAA